MTLTRTFAVILIAVIGSFLFLASAAWIVLKPVDLAVEMQNANRSTNDHTAFERDFQRARWLTVLLINPSLGLAVGLFVGFFQKTRASITAAACLLPQFLFQLYANGWRGWSDERLPPLLAHEFLVFISAIIIAHYVWRLRHRRMENL
jgi:hypothetical protein